MKTPKRPLPASYWVEPGRFLAGEYPGRPNPEQMRQRAIAFLEAGFDTYIDLTAPGEREPYLPALQELAVDYGLTISHQRFSIGDLGLPSNEQMAHILKAVDEALTMSRKVYLHCWAGVGRTGTTVGCYLVQHGLTPDQALVHLAEIYSTAQQSLTYARSPETLHQVDFILNWGRGQAIRPPGRA
jgi:predicted protein tyrosine phosphatase